MRYLLALLALSLTSCAALWLDPIHEVGPDTYQITHEMGTLSPVKGVRQGVIDKASRKCSEQGGNYAKLREEMSPGRTLGYTLTFTCNPSLQPTQYQ